jgi:hypothetical protein
MEHAAVVCALVGADTRLLLQKSQRRNAAGAEQLPRGAQTDEAAADNQGMFHTNRRKLFSCSSAQVGMAGSAVRTLNNQEAAVRWASGPYQKMISGSPWHFVF